MIVVLGGLAVAILIVRLLIFWRRVGKNLNWDDDDNE